MRSPRYIFRIATGGYHRFGLTIEVVDKKDDENEI